MRIGVFASPKSHGYGCDGRSLSKAVTNNIRFGIIVDGFIAGLPRDQQIRDRYESTQRKMSQLCTNRVSGTTGLALLQRIRDSKLRSLSDIMRYSHPEQVMSVLKDFVLYGALQEPAHGVYVLTPEGKQWLQVYETQQKHKPDLETLCNSPIGDTGINGLELLRLVDRKTAQAGSNVMIQDILEEYSNDGFPISMIERLRAFEGFRILNIYHDNQVGLTVIGKKWLADALAQAKPQAVSRTSTPQNPPADPARLAFAPGLNFDSPVFEKLATEMKALQARRVKEAEALEAARAEETLEQGQLQKLEGELKKLQEKVDLWSATEDSATKRQSLSEAGTARMTRIGVEMERDVARNAVEQKERYLQKIADELKLRQSAYEQFQAATQTILADAETAQAMLYAASINRQTLEILGQLDESARLNEAMQNTFEAVNQATQTLHAAMEAENPVALSDAVSRIGDVLKRKTLKKLESEKLEIGQLQPEIRTQTASTGVRFGGPRRPMDPPSFSDTFDQISRQMEAITDELHKRHLRNPSAFVSGQNFMGLGQGVHDVHGIMDRVFEVLNAGSMSVNHRAIPPLRPHQLAQQPAPQKAQPQNDWDQLLDNTIVSEPGLEISGHDLMRTVGFAAVEKNIDQLKELFADRKKLGQEIETLQSQIEEHQANASSLLREIKYPEFEYKPIPEGQPGLLDRIRAWSHKRKASKKAEALKKKTNLLKILNDPAEMIRILEGSRFDFNAYLDKASKLVDQATHLDEATRTQCKTAVFDCVVAFSNTAAIDFSGSIEPSLTASDNFLREFTQRYGDQINRYILEDTVPDAKSEVSENALTRQLETHRQRELDKKSAAEKLLAKDLQQLSDLSQFEAQQNKALTELQESDPQHDLLRRRIENNRIIIEAQQRLVNVRTQAYEKTCREVGEALSAIDEKRNGLKMAKKDETILALGRKLQQGTPEEEGTESLDSLESIERQAALDHHSLASEVAVRSDISERVQEKIRERTRARQENTTSATEKSAQS